jgi:signal transduction histidine kinase/CheY-like chemotaxis protein
MGSTNHLAHELQERTDQLRLAHTRLLEQLRERERIEEQLLNTGKMEAIARLAGGIAHDFKNLLTVIRLQLCVLRRGLPDRPASLASIDEIDQAVGFASALTTKLLAFGRRDGPRGERTDVAGVVLEMEPLLRRLCGESIAISLRVDIESGTVALDATGLEQVLLNLAINARDAMTSGGELTVEVQRRKLDDHAARMLRNGRAGDHVAVVVRDTGIGMDAETLGRVFDPFFTTKSVDRGSGLGLATAQATVEQAGGFIDVRSEAGAGSEFVVYLPRVSDDEERANEPATKETILLVDDEEGVRIALADLLEDAGYRVLAAASGAAALEAVKRHEGPIHLLLADVAMPGMTGFTLASRVRAVMPHIGVIFMSGYVAGEAIDEMAAKFVPKPFSTDHLLREIRETLDALAETTA